jgi:hypothetical protein
MKLATAIKSATPLKPTTTPVTAAVSKPANTEKVEPEIRILKVGSCPSLSGRSSLVFHIACTPKSEVLIRVYKNSGHGFFSDEWVPLRAILQTLEGRSPKLPLTGYVLFPLFRGKSINNSFFLFAILRHEGLVQPSKQDRRTYERIDPKAFLTGIKTLMSSAVALKADSKPQAARDQTKPTATSKKSPSKSSSQ